MNDETHRKGVLAARVFLALMLAWFLPKLMADTGGEKSADGQKLSKQHVAEVYGKVPLAFEANTGQTSDEVQFLSRGRGYTLFLTRNAETVLVLSASSQKKTSDQPKKTAPAKFKSRRESTPPWVARMKLVNTDVTSQAEGLDELEGKANYFVGNDPSKWRTNVPLFSKVQYRNVYPGVDLVYYGNQNQLENDFIVAPGADPQSITLSFTGAEKLSLDSQGNLVLAAKEGEVRFEKPHIYQDVDGAQLEISGDYLLKDVHQVGFQVAAYDRSRPLVIDPTLSYSTYVGGSGFDYGYGIAVDGSGNAYVTGQTTSADFPTTIGAFQMIGPNIPCQYGPGCTRQDAFVTKLNPAGSALVYSTFLGGNFESGTFGIAVDGAGDAYVTGYSYSVDFPTTPLAFQPINRSAGFGYNAFMTKLNPAGSALVSSTYLGGSKFDAGRGIAVDAAGNAYVTGWTLSTDFPITPNAFQPVNRGSSNQRENAFVTKLTADGTTLLYSTYLGGSGSPPNPFGGGGGDDGYGIALDTQNNAYVTGSTCSSDFPVTPLAFQITYQTNCDAFVSKLNPAALLGPASLVYSTYLGGIGSDQAYGIAVDAQENAYVTGDTCSANFPITALAFQVVYQGACDAFVSKLNPSGSGLVYSSFLGGTRGDGSSGIAVDAAGNAYVTGTTDSTDFPVTPDAFQATKAGDAGEWDAFVAVLNPSGSAPLVYSTYLGGSDNNSCPGCYEPNSSGTHVAVDAFGNAYLTGWTYSFNFPTTPGAFQTTHQGASGLPKAFVTKFSGFPTAP
jgi:hypothetical protein